MTVGANSFFIFQIILNLHFCLLTVVVEQINWHVFLKCYLDFWHYHSLAFSNQPLSSILCDNLWFDLYFLFVFMYIHLLYCLIWVAFDAVIRKNIVKYKGREIRSLNELEFINGEVWANVWMVFPCLCIIYLQLCFNQKFCNGMYTSDWGRHWHLSKMRERANEMEALEY